MHPGWVRFVLRLAAFGALLGCAGDPDGGGGAADASLDAPRLLADATVAIGDAPAEAAPLPCPEPISGAPNAPWKVPETQPGSCAPGEWDAIAAACAGRNAAACDAAKQQHARCWGCAYSRKNDDAYTALIGANGVIYPNVGGCIALATGDTSRESCAAVVGIAVFCAYLACGRCDANAAASCRATVQATGACAFARAQAEACLDGVPLDAGADGAGGDASADAGAPDAGLRAVARACGLDAPAAEAIVVARFCGGAADGGADAAGD